VGGGAETFVLTGMLDGRDAKASAARMRWTDPALRQPRGRREGSRGLGLAYRRRGFGNVNVAVDADGNTANGFEHIVATVQTTGPIAAGQDVIIHGQSGGIQVRAGAVTRSGPSPRSELSVIWLFWVMAPAETRSFVANSIEVRYRLPHCILDWHGLP